MTESIWMLHAKKADFDGLAARFDISPVTARIIRNRDIEDEAAFDRYLNGSLEDLYSPGLLPDMEEAVRRIRRAVKEKRRLRIVGDYDIDGVCATAVLYKGCARIGADADYVIPERIRDGYGINEQIIEAAAADGIETLVTCDNGIAAISQIARAKELGLEVIITDHHDIQTDGETGADLMPPADAIVNPKRRDSRYPWPEICGAMVAFKLIGALYDTYGIDRQEWLELLEFAAVATVGDVMKLKDENRIVVKEGLKRLVCTGNPGLKSLILKNAIDPANISAYHIGFVLGPCLNASGRLQTAELAVELLLCGDPARADEIAEELKELNDKRKAMTQENVEAAADQVEKELSRDKVLVIFLPDCHESLAGIVAGRIRERYNKPVFVLTRAEGCAKGSGRSIEAYHMFHALVEVKDLLLKFGGHPMAAGFSLEESDIGEFRRRLNENAEDRLTEDDFIPRVWIDAAMPFEYVTEELIGDLERLEPFGQGNEKPQFAQKSMAVRSVRVMGRNRNVVRLSLANERAFSMDGIIFGDGDAFLEEMGRRRGIDIYHHPTVNNKRKPHFQVVV